MGKFVVLCLMVNLMTLGLANALPASKIPKPAFEIIEDESPPFGNKIDMAAVPAVFIKRRTTTTTAPVLVNRMDEPDSPIVFTEEPDEKDMKMTIQPDEGEMEATTVEPETTTDILGNRHVFDLPINCQQGMKSDRKGICRRIQK
jgi:hypothetical protein